MIPLSIVIIKYFIISYVNMDQGNSSSNKIDMNSGSLTKLHTMKN